MSATLRFAVIDTDGNIIQTLERLGSQPAESWDEIVAMIHARNPGSTVIRLALDDDVLLPDPSRHEGDGDGFLRVRNIDRVALTTEHESRGKSRVQAERDANDEADARESVAAEQLAKVKRYVKSD